MNSQATLDQQLLNQQLKELTEAYELEKSDLDRMADLQKLKNKYELSCIFTSIQNKLSINNNNHQFSPTFHRDLSNLRTSLVSFRFELLREIEVRTDDFPITTARKLNDAIDDVLNANHTASEKDKAVSQFRNTARNAKFSSNTKVLAAAVAGGLIGLALWVGLTVATGGTAGLITFAGLGLAALIVTFGAVHFAARSDSFLRSSNPHDARGKQVSDNLKALLRHRKELSFINPLQATPEPRDQLHVSFEQPRSSTPS